MKERVQVNILFWSYTYNIAILYARVSLSTHEAYVLSDIDECATDPCDHGTCFNGINEYTCTCETYYTGVNCDEGINKNNIRK